MSAEAPAAGGAAPTEGGGAEAAADNGGAEVAAGGGLRGLLVGLLKQNSVRPHSQP